MSKKTYHYSVLMAFGLCALSAPALAEPLVINPYPGADVPAKSAPQIIPEAAVESRAPSPLAEAAQNEILDKAFQSDAVQRPALSAADFKVPQPGDDYFDAPGQTPGLAEADIPESAWVDVPVESAVIEKQAEQTVDIAREPLRVRKTESFDDLVVEDLTVPKALPPVVEVDAPETMNWRSARTSVSGQPQEAAEQIFEPITASVPFEEATRASTKASEQAAAIGRGWRALEGANIRQVLEEWSQDEGVAIIWETQSSFAVLRSFEMQAPYEKAVQVLLDQYKEGQVRPVATLHVDPATQKKTLVVRVIDGA